MATASAPASGAGSTAEDERPETKAERRRSKKVHQRRSIVADVLSAINGRKSPPIRDEEQSERGNAAENGEKPAVNETDQLLDGNGASTESRTVIGSTGSALQSVQSGGVLANESEASQKSPAVDAETSPVTSEGTSAASCPTPGRRKRLPEEAEHVLCVLNNVMNNMTIAALNVEEKVNGLQERM